MFFWDFLLTVPAPLRLLMSLVLTIGISLALEKLMFPRLLAMSKDGQLAFEGEPGVNRPNDIIGRFAPLVTVGFVFLTGITVSQFWTNARLATEATSAELNGYTRVLSYAEQLPKDQGSAGIVAALDAYRNSVTEDQWPLLQHAQATEASHMQAIAATTVRDSIVAAANAGASESPIWPDLTSAADDMLLAGSDRIDSVPQSNALLLLLLMMTLGIANLVVLALASPSYRRLSLLLMGIAAGVTALLMFVAVEMSNPYLVGVHSLTLATP